MSRKPEVKAMAAGKDQRTSLVVIVGIVVIAILVVLVLVQSSRPANSSAPVPMLDLAGVETGITADGHYYRGSLNARIVLIEYEDLRCPYCRQYFAEAEPSIFEQYVKTGLVREESHLVAFLGSPSFAAAEAAACAGEQGKFWEFRHVAFTNQPAETNPDGRTQFVAYATQAGVDVAQFTNCFDTQKYQSRVQQTLAEAQARGVDATPTFFVGDLMYQGAFPFTATGDQPNFKNILDTALAAAGGAP